MMTILNELIARIRHGDSVSFSDSIAVIDTFYSFVPVRFMNGAGSAAPVINEAGSNQGSCKIFYFARLHGLSREQTLALFGDYYWQDVLQHPDAADHANIRAFMRTGWDGVRYDGVALVARVGTSVD
jgi:hypothetical protein